MNLTPEERRDVESLPPPLRALLEAELAAGNALLEIGHGFPAAPCGAWFKLGRPLLAHPQASGGGIDYYDRDTTDYSGEITDATRHFFILEPPHPPRPAPDMDAIRAALQERQGGGPADDADRRSSATHTGGRAPPARQEAGDPPEGLPDAVPASDADAAAWAPVSRVATTVTVERFRRSMEMDYEKWREGTGYDLDLLRTASPADQVAIEDMLLARPVADWRDVEALAFLDSPRARLALERAARNGEPGIRMAVADYAPDLFSESERTAMLVEALARAEPWGGLSQALLQVEEHHPPAVIDALFRGAFAQGGGTAVHFAAMLTFLHGKADSPFDWAQRPFFLRFNTEDRTARAQVFRELCANLGVDPAPYLRSGRRAIRRAAAAGRTARR